MTVAKTDADCYNVPVGYFDTKLNMKIATTKEPALSRDTSPSENTKRLHYGWVILAASFFIGFLCAGSGFSFGVFLNPFRETFASTSAAISIAYSFCLLFYSGLGPLAGWIVDRYGPRRTTMLGSSFLCAGLLLSSQAKDVWQLYVTYALVGVGMSAAYAPLMTTISRWFSQRRGLALGIASAGMGTGPLIIAPLASYLIATYGWRFTLIVMGCAAGLLIPLALLMRKSPAQTVHVSSTEALHPITTQPTLKKSISSSESTDLSLKEALGTRTFWLICTIFLMVGIGLQIVMAHSVPYSEGRGIPPLMAAAVLSTISGTSVLGRIASGAISDRIGRKMTMASSIFVEGLMAVGLVVAPSDWILFVFAAIFGFGYGGHATQFPAITGEMLGVSHMGAILGAAVVFWGLGGAIGPSLAGHIYDVTGNYGIAFLVGTAALLAAAGTSLFLKTPDRKLRA